MVIAANKVTLTMPHNEMSHELATAIRVARAAGDVVMPLFRRGVVASAKRGESRDLVTEADFAADARIRAELRAAFPDHAIFSEESAAAGDGVDAATPTWIIDPIDGTSNFSRGLPLFSISIARFHEGQGKVGVVYAPSLAWLFSAEAGRGAWLNGERLRVSGVDTMERAMLAVDWPRQPLLRQRSARIVAAFGEEVHTVRTVGSAALALAMVAAGWLDIYWHLILQPWDVAAAALLIQEAGGHLSTPSGDPWQPAQSAVLASNGTLHRDAIAMINTVL